MAKRKYTRKPKPDMSHETGFFILPTYDGAGVKIMLRVDNKTVKECVIAEGLSDSEKEALVELSKMVSYCINAGIEQRTLLDMLLKLFSFTRNYNVAPNEEYEAAGLKILQPLLVKYLFRERHDQSIVEVRPRYKTKKIEGIGYGGNTDGRGTSKD